MARSCGGAVVPLPINSCGKAKSLLTPRFRRSHHVLSVSSCDKKHSRDHLEFQDCPGNGFADTKDLSDTLFSGAGVPFRG